MKQSEKMLELVKEYRQSGVSQKEFCLESGISLAKLNYWIGKSKSSAPAGFISLRAVPTRAELGIEYPNGVKISTGGADLSLIARLVKLY